VTQRALKSDSSRSAVRCERGDANNRTCGEQRCRHSRIVETYLARSRSGDELGRHHVDIDLEPNVQGLERRQARAASSEACADDGLMQTKTSAPKRLAAEGVEPENLTTTYKGVACMLLDDAIEGGCWAGLRRCSCAHNSNVGEHKNCCGEDE
jgi:hypothetical protein